MMLLLCFLGLLAGLAHGQDEGFQYQDYSFYFHDTHNLLLTTSPRNCYFTEVKDTGEEISLHEHQEEVEKFVLGSIYKGVLSGDELKVSSLDEMREKYSDLLADFLCKGKNIYKLEIDLSGASRDENLDHGIPGLSEGYWPFSGGRWSHIMG